ncbi:MAG: hypothetical protein AAFO94_05755, partial [Bacteroidota bacterium]
GGDFSCKDFRTWAGTILCIELLPAVKQAKENGECKNIVREIIKRVAAELGNTQAVCKNYYIHPAILESVERGQLRFDKKTRKQLSKRFDQALSPAELLAYQIMMKAQYRIPEENQFLLRKVA